MPFYLKSVSDKSAELYSCPPCGCKSHDLINSYNEPGICQFCSMHLIAVEEGTKKQFSDFVAPLFQIMRSVTPYYNRLLYPSYLVAISLIIITMVNHRKRRSAIYISLYLLSFMLYAFRHQLYGTTFAFNVSSRLLFLPISLLLISGPLLFLYFRSFTDDQADLSKSERYHFLPALILLVFSAVVFLLESDRQLFIYNSFDDYFSLSEQMLFIFSTPYYLIISYRLLQKIETGNFRIDLWLRSLMIFHGIFFIAILLLNTINFLLFDFKVTFIDYYPLWFLISLFIYWSIYFFTEKKASIFPQLIYNRLSDPAVSSLRVELDGIMRKQKPYLDVNLTLQALANTLTISSKELSELLNKGYRQTFYDYVNSYRVEEIKELLLDPKRQHLTNEALAEEAGFKSKSTFINSFRKVYNCTPGEFKRINLRSSAGRK
ncbi:MAG: AraC family transcriptional regulator [Calditrichaeota bacterium]|nr:AraC family transcriptional regulator [Calditrichota bacterium]